VTAAKDSMLVKNDPNWPKNLSAIFNYYFVKNDWSKGIHNTKYAVALLKASLGSLTGVMPSDQEIPKAFDLSQNYPNPFNPNTEIKFSLPKAEKVRLNIYNIAGELVQTLANGDLAPGNYKVTWDGKDKNGSSVASGVYIYRLESKSFTSTKKMVLMK
ncbi:MAG: T9SS type A sorting domain-containing protein, partial [Ignavibacteria bacterium]|nr:T9SS type A sorting domain-containing protein [Ignavibacteria bacterium]